MTLEEALVWHAPSEEFRLSPECVQEIFKSSVATGEKTEAEVMAIVKHFVDTLTPAAVALTALGSPGIGFAVARGGQHDGTVMYARLEEATGPKLVP